MICPSILSADFSDLKNILNNMKAKGLKVVHFDVMDNHFVPNLTFGHKLIQDLRDKSDLFFDAHLMIDSPEKWLDLYIKSGADLITIHYEATQAEAIKEMSQKVRDAGIKFGVSIKPGTEAEELFPFFDDLDLILVMTVEPGFGGQKLIGNCLEKVNSLKQEIKKESKDILIQVDGGINKDNIATVLENGADWFVVGSAFFKEKDYGFFPELLNKLKD